MKNRHPSLHATQFQHLQGVGAIDTATQRKTHSNLLQEKKKNRMETGNTTTQLIATAQGHHLRVNRR